MSARVELGDGLAGCGSAGIGLALADGLRRDRVSQGFQETRRLKKFVAPWRTCVENEGAPSLRDASDPNRARDPGYVERGGTARHEDEVGVFDCPRRAYVGVRSGIDDDERNARLPSDFENCMYLDRRRAGGCGVLGRARLDPRARRALRVCIDQGDGRAVLLRRHGEMDGDSRLPGAALLPEHGDDVH